MDNENFGYRPPYDPMARDKESGASYRDKLDKRFDRQDNREALKKNPPERIKPFDAGGRTNLGRGSRG